MTSTNKFEVEETPFGWWVLCKSGEGYFLKNRRESGFGPTDGWLEMFEDDIIPLYVEQKPKPMTLEEYKVKFPWREETIDAFTSIYGRDAETEMNKVFVIEYEYYLKKHPVPHIHHDVIIAFANGHAVQWQDHATKKWNDIIDPIFVRNLNYRIKPEQ